MRRLITTIIAGATLVALAYGVYYSQGGMFTPFFRESGGTISGKVIISDSLRVAKTSIFTGNVTTIGKLVVGDSLRVGKTSKFLGEMTCSLGVNAADFRASDSIKAVSIAASGRVTGTDIDVSDSVKAVSGAFSGRITGTDCDVSDSLIGATVTTSGSAYFGSSSKFWKCITSGMWTANGVDSVFLKVDTDTFFINQAAASTTTKNVRLDGLLYLPNKVTADSIEVTTLIANVWDTATVAARYIDTTEIKSYFDSTESNARYFDTTEVHWGVGTASGTKTVDTVIVSGITGSSTVIITPKANYTVPLYVSSVVVDTFFVTGAEADTALFTTSGYFYEVKD